MLGYDGVIWKNKQFELGLKRINFSIYSGVPNTFLPSPLPNTGFPEISQPPSNMPGKSSGKPQILQTGVI